MDIDIVWKWAENFTIPNEVQLVEETLTLREEESFSPVTIFAGEVRNLGQSAVDNVRINLALVHNDGHVIEIDSERTVSEVIDTGQTSAFTFEFFGLRNESIKNIIHAIQWGYESNPPPGLPPPSSSVVTQ